MAIVLEKAKSLPTHPFKPVVVRVKFVCQVVVTFKSKGLDFMMIQLNVMEFWDRVDAISNEIIPFSYENYHFAKIFRL